MIRTGRSPSERDNVPPDTSDFTNVNTGYTCIQKRTTERHFAAALSCHLPRRGVNYRNSCNDFKSPRFCTTQNVMRQASGKVFFLAGRPNALIWPEQGLHNRAFCPYFTQTSEIEVKFPNCYRVKCTKM